MYSRADTQIDSYLHAGRRHKRLRAFRDLDIEEHECAALEYATGFKDAADGFDKPIVADHRLDGSTGGTDSSDEI